MPRMKDGKRDYSYDKQYLAAHRDDNAARKRARRKLVKVGLAKTGDGKDVHHVRGVKAGNSMLNLRAISRSKNRSMK